MNHPAYNFLADWTAPTNEQLDDDPTLAAEFAARLIAATEVAYVLRDDEVFDSAVYALTQLCSYLVARETSVLRFDGFSLN